MTTRARAALAALLCALAGVAAWRLRPPPPPPPPGPRRLACAFAPGDELAYRLEVAPRAGDAGAGTALRATLRLVASERVERGEWVFAAVIDPLAGFDAPDRLRAPFALRVGRNCRFEALGWAPDATAAHADAVTRLLEPFEVVLGDGPVARWSAAQRDGNGAFLADYAVSDWAPAATEVTRTAGAYDQRASDDSVVDQVSVAGRFTLAPDSRWLRSLRGSTHHRVRTEGRALDVRLALSLDRVAALAGPALPTREELRAYRWRRPEAAPDDDAHRARLAQARARAEGARDLSAEAALARALALFDADADPMHERAFQHLLGWLLAREGAAAELLAMLRGGRVEGRIHALLFLALEQADTPAARRALIDALSEGALSSMDRQRASLALGGMHTATREAVAALRDASRAPGRGEDSVMERGVALRSVGLLAGDGVPAEVAAEARAVVREAIASDDGPLRRGGLDAAGNARSAGFLPEVRAALDDADARTRAAAAHAMRGMDREAVQPLLAARLAREEDRDVRHELATTLAENGRGTYDDATVRAAADALPRSPEPAVRAQLIHLLGAAAPTRPAARAALAAWLPRETSPELVQLIGRFLDLDTLREALRRRDS